MSYNTRLKSAGLNAALAAKNAGMFPDVQTYEELQDLANKFAEDAYDPEQDLGELVSRIGELLPKCPNYAEVLDQLQAEINVAREQLPIHLAKAN